jgi:hypothetical protein
VRNLLIWEGRIERPLIFFRSKWAWGFVCWRQDFVHSKAVPANVPSWFSCVLCHQQTFLVLTTFRNSAVAAPPPPTGTWKYTALRPYLVRTSQQCIIGTTYRLWPNVTTKRWAFVLRIRNAWGSDPGRALLTAALRVFPLLLRVNSGMS